MAWIISLEKLKIADHAYMDGAINSNKDHLQKIIIIKMKQTPLALEAPYQNN